jgi:alkylation response protein AidB-like acyl-CoA dehydrogenase
MVISTALKTQKILSVGVVLCAFATVPQSGADPQKHVNYTKAQSKAAGFWRVTGTPPQGVSVKWLVIGLGDSRTTMTVRWPNGLGCQTEAAEIQGDTITIVGGHLPAVIQIRGSKNATLSMSGGQIVLHLRKTNEPSSFLCE